MPNSLGWGFYNSGDKVILIERYLDGNAMMEHGKNISEGGPMETHFVKFMEHWRPSLSGAVGWGGWESAPSKV